MMVEAHSYYPYENKLGNISNIVKNVSNIQWHTHTQYRSSSFKM